jgi:hypothetical protein
VDTRRRVDIDLLIYSDGHRNHRIDRRDAILRSRKFLVSIVASGKLSLTPIASLDTNAHIIQSIITIGNSIILLSCFASYPLYLEGRQGRK